MACPESEHQLQGVEIIFLDAGIYVSECLENGHCTVIEHLSREEADFERKRTPH